MAIVKFIKGFRKILVLFVDAVVPQSVKARLNAESFGIIKFVEFAAENVKLADRILDAGAGACPYKKHFLHARYESADVEESAATSPKGIHDFFCSLDSIPKPDNYYDAILNSQVLEHVEYPQKVIDEFYRILKPGGKLFLTAPQAGGIHEAPYNFFNFTKYGLESLFKNAGFKINFIKPRGGFFWQAGYELSILPFHVLSQYMFDDNNKKSIKPIFFILLPFYIISIPFCRFIIPLLFFYLDRLDKKREYTLGYACYCTKESAPQ